MKRWNALALTLLVSSATAVLMTPGSTACPLPQQPIQDFVQGGSGNIQNDRQEAEDKRSEALKTLQAARERLKKAETDEATESAVADVRAAINEYFERDMEHRRRELARLRERVNETESQLSKRQSSREELVKLQLNSFVHEAEGLGLFRNQNADNWASYGSYGEWRASYPIAVSLLSPGQDPSADESKSAELLELRQEELRRTRAARQKLLNAQNEDAQKEAAAEVEAALNAYFDADMAYRQNELGEVRQKLADMEARLEKREGAKEQVIDLQLKMIVNEANGLGFFSDGGSVSGEWFPATFNRGPWLDGSPGVNFAR